MNTRPVWETYGERDPYFGVLAHERFRGKQLTESAHREFFQSGHEYVARVLGALERHFGARERAKALDFGCGVGRLAIPLAGKFETVVGVDISRAMLDEARANATRFGVGNLRLHGALEELHGERGTFSFVNSVLVFQHIWPRQGLRRISEMLALLGPGGCGALQLLYGRSRFAAQLGERPWYSKLALRLRRPFRLLRQRITGADLDMQMIQYPLNKVLYLLHQAGVREIHAEFTDDSGHLGVNVYFSRGKP